MDFTVILKMSEEEFEAWAQHENKKSEDVLRAMLEKAACQPTTKSWPSLYKEICAQGIPKPAPLFVTVQDLRDMRAEYRRRKG